MATADKDDSPLALPRVTPATRALLPAIDTVVFDMDGVLLDITGSIRQVNLRAIPAYLRTLPGWGVRVVPPVDSGEGPRLAPTEQLLEAVRPHAPRG